MPNSIARRPRSSRPTSAFVIVGVILYIAGSLASLHNLVPLGADIRISAIALFTAASLRKPTLLRWTFLSILAGVELGLDAPHVATQIHFIGDLFLRLIRMVIAPLIFATITTGIASHTRLSSIGRVAVKAFVCFEVITTLGLIIGAAAMDISGAGWGVVLSATTDTVPVVQSQQSWQQIILNFFPENIAQAVAQNQILQVAVFAVLFGIALALLPQQKRSPLLSLLQSLADAMFQLTRIIMYFAPLAAGAVLAYTIGSMGLATLVPLAKLVITGYVALVIFCLLVLLPAMLIFGIPVRKFIAAVGEPSAIAFATTTSEAALPLAMERMEEFGVPPWIVAFVIPAGYSFNMVGLSVYLSLASIFAAQVAGIHLSIGRQISMLAILMLASKGVAGIPRAVLIVLMATASAIHIPAAPILLLLGVDAIMDMGRSMMNVIGNCLATAIIARSEGAIPRQNAIRAEPV